jgi:hypothetical protein
MARHVNLLLGHIKLYLTYNNKKQYFNWTTNHSFWKLHDVIYRVLGSMGLNLV